MEIQSSILQAPGAYHTTSILCCCHPQTRRGREGVGRWEGERVIQRPRGEAHDVDLEGICAATSGSIRFCSFSMVQLLHRCCCQLSSAFPLSHRAWDRPLGRRGGGSGGVTRENAGVPCRESGMWTTGTNSGRTHYEGFSKDLGENVHMRRSDGLCLSAPSSNGCISSPGQGFPPLLATAPTHCLAPYFFAFCFF
jgi:hypothetical protein